MTTNNKRPISKDTIKITSEHGLSWAKKIEVELKAKKREKEFDMIEKSKQRLKHIQSINQSSTQPKRQNIRKCRYCRT